MQSFEVGNQVQLNSGGPIMTVQHIGDYASEGFELGALCVWFDRNEPREKVFDVRTLTLFDESKYG